MNLISGVFIAELYLRSKIVINGEVRVTANTIGIREYLNATYDKFLHDLAKQNGGVFIGK
jgi:hypothetical protein